MLELIYPQGRAPVIPPRLSPLDPGSEMFPIVDANGVVIAQAERAYCHSGFKALHPVVHLHIYDRFNRIYLQKRSRKKDLYPGRWDTAIGGHVSYGESIMEALYREAAEELGFTEFNPVYLDTYIYESQTERELVSVFAAIGSFRLYPDRDELEDGRYWSMDELERSIPLEVFTPNFVSEFERIRHTLESLL